MPPLPNPRHERFAQELAKGKTATEAYVLAGYKPNDGNAATLKGKQRVSDRVADLQAKSAKAVEVTAETLVAEFEEARQVALEQKQGAAMAQATIGKARLLGLIIEKREDVTPRRDRGETLARLAELTAGRSAGGNSKPPGRVGGDRAGDETIPTVPGHGTA